MLSAGWPGIDQRLVVTRQVGDDVQVTIGGWGLVVVQNMQAGSLTLDFV